MRRAPLPVALATSGDGISLGVVYLARPDQHLTVRPDRHFAYTDGTRIKFLRSSANPLFETAARAFDGRLIAVVLTGGGSDATDGVQTVKANGGVVIAQDKATSEQWGMPEAAVRTGPWTTCCPSRPSVLRSMPSSTAGRLPAWWPGPDSREQGGHAALTGYSCVSRLMRRYARSARCQSSQC
jgi:hypothetical protein